jgi:hypothetical protein
MVINLYPEHTWFPWKFNSIPKNYWDDKTNQLKYMNWLANRLNVQKMEDWYQVSWEVSFYIISS